MNLKFEITNSEKIKKLTKEQQSNLKYEINLIQNSIAQKNNILKQLKNDIIIFAYSENRIIGFIHLAPLTSFTHDKAYFDYLSKNLYIDFIAINKNFQGKGIAIKLYDKAIKYAEKQNFREISALFVNDESLNAFTVSAQKNNCELICNNQTNTITLKLNNFNKTNNKNK